MSNSGTCSTLVTHGAHSIQEHTDTHRNFIADAQRRARHANFIHPADEATGQVDAAHPPQSDAIELAITGHDVRIALRTMQERAFHSFA